ncbi:UTP15 C terminal-domain-containing protein [Lipomyces arxii]|uniref:UTP15 C terminal-domain-containing protein n=1 Tax=Lipomyces arxii TaxID=56418 RepID=UPI0034CDB4C6
MSVPLEKIQIVRKTAGLSQISPEQRFWRLYKTPLLVKEHGPITHTSFCSSGTHEFAVTSGTRIQIFSSRTRQVVRTISRFKDTAYSGEFRPDGKLIVAGDASGLVQVFDTKSRSILLTLSPTSRPTHVTKFHPKTLTTLLSASDDQALRLWDITSTEPVSQFRCHTDYVRTANFLSPSSNTVVTGCYDGVLRVLDPRTPEKAALTLDHGAPIESTLVLTSTVVLSSGGPTVKVWDLVAGRMVKELGNFQKSVTTLCTGGRGGSGSNENTVLAGGLDGHVKVFDSTTWDVQFGWKFGDAVLTTAVSPDQKHFVTGLVSGVLSIRTRKTEPKVKQGIKADRSTNFTRMIRGGEYQGQNEHQILIDNNRNPRRRKLRLFEQHLNAFRWNEALDSAFSPGMTSELTVTVMDELKRRGKVKVSLAGRDEGQLEPLLRWAVKSVDDYRNVDAVADWMAVVADMYVSVIEKSPVLDDLIRQLRRKLERQLEIARDARKLEGMVEMLIQSR